jgi:hypothetical protein
MLAWPDAPYREFVPTLLPDRADPDRLSEDGVDLREDVRLESIGGLLVGAGMRRAAAPDAMVFGEAATTQASATAAVVAPRFVRALTDPPATFASSP